jgi:hypothetical protein
MAVGEVSGAVAAVAASVKVVFAWRTFRRADATLELARAMSTEEIRYRRVVQLDRIADLIAGLLRHAGPEYTTTRLRLVSSLSTYAALGGGGRLEMCRAAANSIEFADPDLVREAAAEVTGALSELVER